MDRLLDCLDQMSAVLILCAALFILLFSYRETDRLLFSIKEGMSKQNIIYQQWQESNYKENTVTYEMVIASLIGKLDHDVQIDQVLLEKEDYNYQSFDFSKIPNKQYLKKYEYDAVTGEIKKVIFY